jgi:hypothetical protein
MKDKLFLIGGIVGGPFFVITYMIQGFFREEYNWLRHPVSSLAIGEYGWIQITNFFITGFCFLCFAYGLLKTLKPPFHKVSAALLFMIIGVGLTGAGIFVTDPIAGYPPELPYQNHQLSFHGKLHNIFSFPVFIGIIVACLSFRKKFRLLGKKNWASYSFFSGISMITMFAMAGFGFADIDPLKDYSGLLQRFSIMVGWFWISAVAVYFYRTADSQ